MAIELCTSLGLLSNDLSGKLVAISEEHGSDASFLLGSLMWNLSKSSSSLCLVALHNPGPHYYSVAKKLGFNLRASVDEGTTVLFEPFHSYIGANGDFNDVDMHNQDNVKKLFLDVHKSLASISGKKCLIIDDLSELMNLGASVSDTVAFLQSCRNLQNTDSDLAIVICSHSSENNDDQKLVSNFTAHVADLTMTVAALKTGFSANVTGRLEVVDRLTADTTTALERHFHYKLTDRTVKLFAPGTVGIQT